MSINAVAPGLPVPLLPQDASGERTSVLCQESSALPIRSKTNLLALQMEDPVIGPFSRCWKKGTAPTRTVRATLPLGTQKLLNQWPRIRCQQGVLYRSVRLPGDAGETLELLLPQCLKQEVLRSLHDDHGHQGIERTISLV